MSLLAQPNVVEAVIIYVASFVSVATGFAINRLFKPADGDHI